MAGQSQSLALVGKLLPQTFLYILVFLFMDVCFFQILAFPCQCGLWAMFGWGVLTVIDSQCFGVFLFGIMAGRMRLSMCISSLWGILSFSLAGFTYPVTDMAPVLQTLSWAFPLRHYYLINVNQALYGNSIGYVWSSVMAFTVFCILPLTVVNHYRKAILEFKYEK